MDYKMKSSDVFIRGEIGDKYPKIKSALGSSGRLNEPDFQLLVALFGLDQNESESVVEGKDYSTISRVGYEHNVTEFDIRFGLVTILKHLDDDYQTVTNKMAFVKNASGESYEKLPNVSAFYKALRSGIRPLYDILNIDNINDNASVYRALNRYLDDEYSEVQALISE
jgi:hypothetical protein